MLTLRHHSFDLPFEYPFVTHHGLKTHQPSLVVSLGLGGITGYGEAPAISYYNITVAKMIENLEAKRGLIEKHALTDPKRFWHFLHHLLPGEHFLTAALDIAGWDLFAQMRRMPLFRLLGLSWDHIPVTDYTIGMDSIETMVAKLQAHPWQLYKIKAGRPGDIDILRRLRQHTLAPFRVDANEGWTFEETKTLLPELHLLNVTLVEQPLPLSENEAMKELKAISPIPLFADESCRVPEDVKTCATLFDGINIKLTKCGGITPALDMIKQARTLGLKVMLGSMNESTIGTAAIAHLLPLTDETDCDGPLLLKSDIATGLSYQSGVPTLSGGNGLGVKFTGLRTH